MFGFIVGTACLVGFIFVWKGECGQRFRSRWHWILRKLDTSPAQERVVRNAFASVKQGARTFAHEGKFARRELADLLRAADFDERRVSDWFATREEELKKLRESAVQALGEVHEVLDDQQREQLATLIERSSYWPRAWRGHGPYRHQPPEVP